MGVTLAPKKKKKKPPTLNAKIRSALRLIWMRSEIRRSAVNRAKLPYGFGWQCEKCKTATNKPEVDHIEPVGGGSWDGIIERMFCSADKLQVLCRECHKGKK